MSPKQNARPQQLSGSVAGYMLAGVAVTVLMVGGLGGWAATTEISGAIVAPGTVVVETNVKKVQHPTGGVVGEILVKNGMKVKAGDLLLLLDETVTRANLSMVTKQLDELLVRETRLKAERDDANFFETPDVLLPRVDEPQVQDILSGEQSLFKSRRESQSGQKAQLQERIAQLDQEFEGITAQFDAKGREIELIAKELSGLAELEAKQLVTTTKVAALKREQARLQGEQGQYKASAAQTKGKVAEIGLQIVRLDQELKTEVVKELREIQSKQAEYNERKIAADDQLRRVEIRAPQSGLVHQLSVFTVGGVVNPGDPIMLIVPEGDRLVVEARIGPQDIDQVFIGQTAMVRFAAFDQRSTPEVKADVIGISADLTRDPNTGEPYFLSRVAITEQEILRLGANKLMPGMPADVQIRTQDRTALSYLLKPLEDQINKAFRER